MEALFIGQAYIDVTFLTDRMPTGDEKHDEAGLPTLADIAAIQVGKRASRTRVESGR